MSVLLKSMLAITAAFGMCASGYAQNATCKVRDQNIASIYKGDCKDGLANGQGLAKGRDTFQGEFKDGDKVKGKYTWGPSACKSGKCLQTYNGEFSDDAMHGFGEATWTDGDTYKGQWSKGRPTGPTEKFKSEQASACSKPLGEYQKERCKVMTMNNFQCIQAATDSYKKMCKK